MSLQSICTIYKNDKNQIGFIDLLTIDIHVLITGSPSIKSFLKNKRLINIKVFFIK